MSDVNEKSDDFNLLEELKQKLYHQLPPDLNGYKIGDLLKVIELKNKLAATGTAERKFWLMIDELRRENLAIQSRLPGMKATKTKTARRKKSNAIEKETKTEKS
jgi:hypothetical protein